MMKKLLVALLTFLVPIPGYAAPAGFIMHRDNAGNVYVPGPPSGEINLLVQVDGVNSTQTITANACGIAVLRATKTKWYLYLKLNGSNLETPTQEATIPSCRNGQLSESRPNNFIVPASGSIAFVGLTPGSAHTVDAVGGKLRRLKVNQCGWGRLSNTEKNPLQEGMLLRPTLPNGVSIPGMPLRSFASLPVQPKWICKKTGTNYTVYKPI
jgi:hypothetical protein